MPLSLGLRKSLAPCQVLELSILQGQEPRLFHFCCIPSIQYNAWHIIGAQQMITVNEWALSSPQVHAWPNFPTLKELLFSKPSPPAWHIWPHSLIRLPLWHGHRFGGVSARWLLLFSDEWRVRGEYFGIVWNKKHYYKWKLLPYEHDLLCMERKMYKIMKYKVK